ncbi:MAG: hypothetical protein CVU39_16800 [Chloroflexi bacterium HGW-Chloroflexi-10]|nr:MAG: hypothetical protein CVU39_16800 [Chloroflexi bacterium HGW-Chloroflexi-10]
MTIPPIAVTCLVTLILGLMIWGGFFYMMDGRRKKFFWLLLPALPLSLIVNLWVKAPLDLWVRTKFGITGGISNLQPGWYILFVLFLAPFTEELIKLVPIIIPSLRKWILKDAVWVGMFSGLGFGLGEAAYLAYGIANSPQFSRFAWYQFGGFMGERFVVFFIHAVLTAVLVTWIAKGRNNIFFGYLIAVMMHALVNSGVIIFRLGWAGEWLPSAALMICVIGAAFVFENLRKQWMQQNREIFSEQDIVYFQREV